MEISYEEGSESDNFVQKLKAQGATAIGSKGLFHGGSKSPHRKLLDKDILP